jgi:hypothetical protein
MQAQGAPSPLGLPGFAAASFESLLDAGDLAACASIERAGA